MEGRDEIDFYGEDFIDEEGKYRVRTSFSKVSFDLIMSLMDSWCCVCNKKYIGYIFTCFYSEIVFHHST